MFIKCQKQIYTFQLGYTLSESKERKSTFLPYYRETIYSSQLRNFAFQSIAEWHGTVEKAWILELD